MVLGRNIGLGPWQRGFTLVELVVVMILIGILAAVAVPRMSDTSMFNQSGFHDEVVAALRYAQKTAVSHRRLVCADVAAASVTLRIAANNPAAACGTAILRGPDGNDAFARSTDAALASVAPTGTLFFQPNGNITTDAAGATPWTASLTVTGTPAITIQGATGYVK